ncbi:MAG: hypothetical protein GAK34_00426 [Delftia tsuruhatensis]|nr:MAG: hypothetical protein GAK34_00426 [Delftia tsuruhatensis]
MLHAQAVLGPVAAGGLQAVQQARRSAGMDAGSGARRGQQGGVVGAPAFLRHVQVQPGAMLGLQRRQQRHARAAPAAVVDFIGQAQRPGAPCHGRDGRDADAAGHQDQVAGAFVQREMVARAPHLYGGAAVQMLMHPGRAATAVGLAQHGNLVAAGVLRVAAQRVLARQARVAALQVDVRARRPARQGVAIGGLQAQAQHAFGGSLGLGHDHGPAGAALQGFADAHGLARLQQGGTGALGVQGRVPLHPQVLGAPERGVGHVGEPLLGQPHVGQAARELLEEDLHLHARQVLAHALVRAIAEGQVVAGVVAVDVEEVGIGEMPLVMVGRRGHDEQLRARRHGHAADHHVARGQAPPGGHRAVVAQAFLHGIGDQRGVLADLLPGAGMLQQQLDGVGRGIGRGLVRGHDAGHHHGVQVGVGDDLGKLLLLAYAVLHPARRIGVLAHLGQHLAGQLPEVAHRMGHGHLLLGPGPAPGVDGVGDGVLAQPVHVLLGHAEKVQGHGQRHLPQHLVHKVGAAVVDEAVHIGARQLAHHGLVVAQLLGRERVHQRAAARHVRGLVLVDQGAVQREAVGGQHGIGLLARGRDLLQRDRGTEGDVVAEHRLDVVEARDHPVAQLRAVEHRLLLARPAHIFGRVLLVAVAERVEGRGTCADGAARGAGLAAGLAVVEGAARGGWRKCWRRGGRGGVGGGGGSHGRFAGRQEARRVNPK